MPAFGRDTVCIGDRVVVEIIEIIEIFQGNGTGSIIAAFFIDEKISRINVYIFTVCKVIIYIPARVFDTARQYMQEADAIGIIPSGQPDDPLTLRYAYSFAVVTHQELKTQLHNNSLSYNDAASRIISAAKNADYNPILMVDLARYLDAVYDTRKAGLIKDACKIGRAHV